MNRNSGGNHFSHLAEVTGKLFGDTDGDYSQFESGTGILLGSDVY